MLLTNKSVKDVHTKIGTARFITNPNTTRTRASRILTWSKAVPTALIFWLVTLCSDFVLTIRMAWSHSSYAKYFLKKYSPAPVSNLHCTGRILCEY